MERALKERIVGAVVLVALVVLVVPVFLDGPPGNGEVHTERVPLPGQDAQKTQTVVLERQRSEPVPVQSVATPAGDETEAAKPVGVKPADSPGVPVTSASAPPGERNEDPEEKPDEEPDAKTNEKPVSADPPEVRTADAGPSAASPAATRPATVPAATMSTTGMFAVQLGSFSSKANAEKLAAELRRQGFAAFLSRLDAGAGPLHRVRVGPQKDRQAAASMAARLAAAGHKGQVVTHP